jgi:hypothetical protein
LAVKPRNGMSMTTQPDFDQLPTFTITELLPVSSDPHEDFLHPVLEMFRPAPQVKVDKKPRLYLVPSTFGEEFDAEFAPQPTSAASLPDIKALMHQFIHNVLEIWAGRRSSQQLQLVCHYTIYSQLQHATGSLQEIGRVRKIRITEPLDGICEATVTVRFGVRLRVVAIRFEGLDGRWLCTSLTLI